jgi:hypothetical protein
VDVQVGEGRHDQTERIIEGGKRLDGSQKNHIAA